MSKTPGGGVHRREKNPGKNQQNISTQRMDRIRIFEKHSGKVQPGGEEGNKYELSQRTRGKKL